MDSGKMACIDRDTGVSGCARRQKKRNRFFRPGQDRLLAHAIATLVCDDDDPDRDRINLDAGTVGH
jgi:hypothetical protein